MTPELREFALSLPLDVRRELLKVDGPCWFLHGRLGRTLMEAPDRDDPLEGHVMASGSIFRLAYLPVSPIAIALHAAKLSGDTDVVGVHVSLTGCSRAESPDLFVLGADGVTLDSTGHRAAIALLQKVMSP